MVLNSINLEIINAIPLNGVDTHIACSGCAAACCREGVIMPLSADETEFLREAGTGLEEHDVSEQSKIKRIIHHMALSSMNDRKEMRLTTDCGYLDTDDSTGRLVCTVYDDERRPEICGDFKMGSFACGLLQLKRLSRD